MDKLTRNIIKSGVDLARKSNASAVFVYADVLENIPRIKEIFDGLEPVLVTKSKDQAAEALKVTDKVVRVPDIPLARMGQIKMAILIAMSENLLKKGDRIVCLSGVGESGKLDTVVVMEIGEEFELFKSDVEKELTRTSRPAVFERVIEIASKLGVEGREGKPVGTLFVIGDTQRVMRHSRQMIFNPFKGYPEKERNILDPKLEETVKEFSTIDGAFVIRASGVIEAAGRYLLTTTISEKLPQGLGARHEAAASITAATRAVAIAVSESTGNVSVFKNGKIVMEIERPRKQQEAAPVEERAE